MTLIRSLIIFSIGCASLCFTSFGLAAATLEPVTVGYSTFSGAYLPLWIAVEDRLGRKYGLELNRSMPAEYGRSSFSPAAKSRSSWRAERVLLHRIFSASKIK